MLNFSSIASELSKLSSAALAYRARSTEQLNLALELCNVPEEIWASKVNEINNQSSQLLTAKLISKRRLNDCIDPVECPTEYTAIAVDGSQIPLDRHSFLPYYLINVGFVTIHYGSAERPIMASSPTLYYTDNDLLRKGQDGQFSYMTENQIASVRNEKEISKTAQLVANYSDRKHVIAFIDGPLILWAQDPNDRNRHTAPAISELCKAISEAFKHEKVLVGYISRPGSRDVVNAIRMASQVFGPPFDVIGENIDRITDAGLFARILSSGQRSLLFESTANVLSGYTAGTKRIGFYYLNTGSEIARVEIPIGDTEHDLSVDLSHSLILDQIKKGIGYPVALIEAHEQAVVRSADRAAVERLISNELQRSNVPLSITRKALSKRIRPI